MIYYLGPLIITNLFNLSSGIQSSWRSYKINAKIISGKIQSSFWKV